MASPSDDHTAFIHRFSDIAAEPRTMLMPIEGYDKMPLVSLEEAVEPLVLLVRDLQRCVWIMKQRCENPADNLSPDESAAIMLYTAEWEPYSDSLYYILNATLRTEDRNKLKPWFLYLKLLFTALLHLPPIGHETVYRGIKLNISRMYPQRKSFVWWGFSSCTTTINVLDGEQFFGKTGARTLFVIDCYSGRDICRHSYIEKEKEVLLLPATQFTVTGSLNQGPDLHIIQLKETEPLFTILESRPIDRISNSISKANESPKKHLSRLKVPLFMIKMLSRTPETYQNSKLEKMIDKCEPRSLINLDRQSLTDQDIPIVIQQAIINKQCKMLHLSYNEITFQGLSNLAEALHNNTTLEGLYIFNNHVADNGVHFLAQVLSTNNSNLKAISLGGNNITDEGVRYLTEMLKTNKILIELWLPCNEISDQGVQLLANVLIHHNTSLTRISLDVNKLVTDSSVDFLIDIINRNHSLDKLSVCDCKISKAGKAKLREVAKLKKDIELNF